MDRQVNAKSRSLARRGLDRNFSIVRLDDLPANKKPQPGAGFTGLRGDTVETLEKER